QRSISSELISRLDISYSQISLTDVVVVQECVGCIGKLNLAVFENVASVRRIKRVEDVLLDDQDGRSGFHDRVADIENVCDNNGCETKRWFVEHQNFRPGHHAASDRNHLLFAAGQ